jgi:putative sulfotransferase
MLSNELAEWPVAPVGDQYRRLFSWLAKQFDKRLWVERSAGGLGMTHQFLATFPEARIIHLVRDGRDAALSMKAHKGFRHGVMTVSLGQYLEVDPIISTDRTHLDRVPADLHPFLPEHFTVEVLDDLDVPVTLCGGFWTQQLESGLKVLSSLPDDRLLTLRYEDFFVDPKRQLDDLAAFLGEEFVDEDWSARCAATVRPPRSTWRDLPDDDARALTEACRPGFELLRAAGVDYEF